jgi:hypothetical protein
MPDDPRENLTAFVTALLRALAVYEAAQRPATLASTSEDATVSGPALISVSDAASLLGISRASAYRYADAGLLPVKRLGRRVYVVRARLVDLEMPDPTTNPEADAA